MPIGVIFVLLILFAVIALLWGHANRVVGRQEGIMIAIEMAKNLRENSEKARSEHPEVAQK